MIVIDDAVLSLCVAVGLQTRGRLVRNNFTTIAYLDRYIMMRQRKTHAHDTSHDKILKVYGRQ